MRASFVTAALFAACARAIEVTNPTKGQVVDLSAGFKVTWTTVSTDPTSAHLFLVNQAGGHTPYSKDLGEVDLTKGSFTVTLDDVPNDKAYQFNIQSVQATNTGILAQSQQFEVKSSGKKPTTTTTSAASSSSVSSSAVSSASSAASSAISSAASSTLVPSVTKTTGATSTSKTAAATSAVRTGGASNTVVGSGLLALVAGVAAIVA